MSKYNVLWLDDQFETSEAIIEEALMNDIILIGFSNSEEGIKELNENYKLYDAVILDGFFYEKPDQTGSHMTPKAFGKMGMALDNLKTQKVYMPWFIYSGQPRFKKEENIFLDFFKDDYGNNRKIYDKNNDEHFSELCKQIKKAAQEKPLRKAKLLCPSIFEVFKNNYLDGEKEWFIANMIIKLESSNFTLSDVDFNSLRGLLEKLVDKAFEKQIIPFEVGTKNITETINFMCDNNPNYKLVVPYFHSTINFILPTLLAILHDGSHYKNDLKIEINDYIQKSERHNIFKSCLYQLLEVIVSFNTLFKKVDNKIITPPFFRLIQSKNIYEGSIEQDDQDNFFCGKHKLSYMTVYNNFELGQKIRILIDQDNNDLKTKHLYPKFASKFEKIT
jgi:hypothetical protein